jgi:glyoxylase-like metal-dependent hydrolase (beta-lactamase superfamily II)
VKIPLEDSFSDIVGKACRGLKLSDEQVARQAGVTPADVAAVKGGDGREGVLAKIAPVLGLGAAALVASAKKAWYPADPGPIDGLICFNTPFEDMTVNSFLVFDPSSKTAAAFDTGADCTGMLEAAKKQSLTLGQILLTHIHGDHVMELDRLKEKTNAKAFVSDREPIDGAEPFADGKEFHIGKLRVKTLRTSGHARGGVTFVVTGLAKRLAVVGDAVFAGSMGGGAVSYEEALRTNRENILTLPDDTIICPGHGPLSTVGEQKKHNPFFTK